MVTPKPQVTECPYFFTCHSKLMGNIGKRERKSFLPTPAQSRKASVCCALTCESMSSRAWSTLERKQAHISALCRLKAINSRERDLPAPQHAQQDLLLPSGYGGHRGRRSKGSKEEMIVYPLFYFYHHYHQNRHGFTLTPFISTRTGQNQRRCFQ